MPYDPAADVLNSAPELASNPGLAADAMNTPDPGQSAQHLSYAAGHAGLQAGLDQSLPKEQHQSFVSKVFGFFKKDIVQPVEHVGGMMLDDLSKPLQEVQHQYRYLSDVTENHGIVASTLERLAMITAGAIGTVFASPAVGILAAEGTGEALGHIAYKDSWDRTADGANYRDKHGHLVNPGYDLANVVDNIINGHDYTPNKGVDMPTGIVNAIFDLSLDPVVHGLSRAKEVSVGGSKFLRLASRDLSHLSPEEAALVDTRPSVADATMPADRLVDAYNGRAGVRAMVDHLAKPEVDTEFILNNHPMLRKLAPDLGKATSPDDVLNVFRDALTMKNYSVLPPGLPTTGITRRPVALSTQIKNKILNAGSTDATSASTGETIVSPVTGLPVENPNSAIRAVTTYRTFNVPDELKKKLNTERFNLMDDGAQDTMKSLLKVSQNERTANAILAKFLNSNDLSERHNIFIHAVTDMLRAYGLKDDDELVTKWLADNGELVDGAHNSAVYGVGPDGKPLSMTTPDGKKANVGLLLGHQGTVSFPNYDEIRKAQREAGSTDIFGKVQDAIGKGDEWLYKHYTTRIFKSLALLSVGFALRVSAGELIPATLKFGGGRVTQGILGNAAAKLNPDLFTLADGGTEDLLGRSANAAGQDGKLVAIDPVAKTATLRADGVDTVHDLKDVTIYHEPIGDPGILKMAREMGFQLDKEDIPHVRAAIGKALYGVSNALRDSEFTRQAMFNASQWGKTAPQSVLTGGGDSRVMVDANATNRALRVIGKKLPANTRLGDKFSAFGGESQYHELYWQHALAEAGRDEAFRRSAVALQAALDQGVPLEQASKEAIQADLKAMKNAVDEHGRNPYLAAMSGTKIDLEEYAKVRHQNLLGLITGRNGTLIHDGSNGTIDALGHIAAGTRPTLPELQDVPIADRPTVKGRVEEPIPVGKTGLLQHITDFGFHKVLDPIINTLSREPIFTTASTLRYKQMKGFVDAGLIPEDVARMRAAQAAVHDMLPLIHNTEYRSQFSELARNYMPFYFAQEQAYKRYGRVIFKDPVAFEKFRLATHGLHSSGIINSSGGQNYIILPGVGQTGSLLTQGAGAFGIGVTGGIPAQVSGGIASLKSVTPSGLLGENELPSVSPLVAVAAKEIENFFPATEPGLSAMIGPIAQNQSMFDDLIPNATLKRIIQATPAGENSRSFQTAFLYSLANAARRSEDLRTQAQAAGVDTPQGQRLMDQANAILPGPDASDQQRQAAVDRIRNSTRIMFMFRAFFGAVSPLSPKVDVGDVQLRQEVADEIKKAGDPAVGIQNFLDKHPDATADTVFLSDARYTGNSVPAGKKALEWVTQHRDLIAGHQLAAAYLVPQTTDFDQEAYNQELATGLRQRRTPEQFLTALYAAATNAVYYKSLDKKKQMEATADPAMKSAINAQFAQYTQKLAYANPVWWADLNDPRKQEVAHYALEDLRAVLGSKNPPDSPQAGLIQTLINSYDTYARNEAVLRATGTGGLGELKRQWDDYLTQFSDEHPQAAAVVNGVFRRLPKYDDAAAGANAGPVRR